MAVFSVGASAAVAGVHKTAGRGSVTASPGGLNFGSVPVGAEPLKLIYVTNVGQLPQILEFGTTDQNVFFPLPYSSSTDDCYTHVYNIGIFETRPLLPGETCTFGVYFGPPEAGSYTGTLVSEWYSDETHFTTLSTKLRGTGY